MVQNNKVLTVSYGTFSCTLEGFDDSFETMKAIAEYFRDLAADDRYFGSEPPQPDAEMLTRIARRDASQRVEARQNESGLLLRATQTTEAPVAAEKPAPHTAAVNVAETPAHVQPQPTSAQTGFAEAEPVADTPPPAADSIAAKLQRIRAVVSHSDVPAAEYSEDEDSSLLAKSAPPVDAVAAAFEAGALSADDFAEPKEPEAQETEELAAPAVDEALDEEAAEPQAAETVDALIPEVAETQIEETVDLQAPLTPQPLQIDEIEDAPVADQSAAAPLLVDLEDVAEDDFDEEDAPNILNVEDVAIESDDEPVEDDLAQGVLTADDEMHLLTEISEIEQHLSGRSSQKLADDADPDQDMSRLMAKTGEHMDDPSSSDARETYSHLRTAVAATEADRDGQARSEEAADKEYRGDLASVVSPRRPEIKVTSMRPAPEAPAPLKLVAEQRVDEHGTSANPVSPRRVTTDQETSGSEEGGFAQFAQEQGAQSLPDLLEAAAAYLSFIEGQEQFSRPQLMNKVRSLKQDEFNREESLRSFGQLLRDGKIEKAGGGRFAASNLIGFRPDDERAVG
nr:hypothetical protein [Ruegeria sp. HKCCSP351]